MRFDRVRFNPFGISPDRVEELGARDFTSASPAEIGERIRRFLGQRKYAAFRVAQISCFGLKHRIPDLETGLVVAGFLQFCPDADQEIGHAHRGLDAALGGAGLRLSEAEHGVFSVTLSGQPVGIDQHQVRRRGCRIIYDGGEIGGRVDLLGDGAGQVRVLEADEDAAGYWHALGSRFRFRMHLRARNIVRS